MPRVIETDAEETIELGALVEALEEAFDPSDEEAMGEWAPALRRLANNRTFLGDLVVEELKRHCAGQAARNPYGPQVILLHGGSRRFLLRANLWPGEGDSVVVNSGTDTFFYGVPHDHNFSFLTVGYLGPGYRSDYYEFDYERVLGVAGEPAEIRFVERSCLSPGKVMLYRKHLDIHSQLPPESLSVSLNIMALHPGTEFLDQYQFDIERSAVAGPIHASGVETLVRLAAHFGGGNGRDLIESVVDSHPSERIRFAAWRARASAERKLDARIAVYEEAAARSDGLVRALAEREANRLAAARPWIEGPPENSRATAL